MFACSRLTVRWPGNIIRGGAPLWNSDEKPASQDFIEPSPTPNQVPKKTSQPASRGTHNPLYSASQPKNLYGLTPCN